MALRIYLILCAVIWLPYGVFCFLFPGYLGLEFSPAVDSAVASS